MIRAAMQAATVLITIGPPSKSKPIRRFAHHAGAVRIRLAKSNVPVDLNQSVQRNSGDTGIVDLGQHGAAAAAQYMNDMTLRPMANAVLDARLMQGLLPRLSIFRDVAPTHL